jgi:hypothetical protein
VVVIRLPSEDFDSDDRFFQLAVFARQVLLDQKAQESRHTPVLSESGTRQHPLELSLTGR